MDLLESATFRRRRSKLGLEARIAETLMTFVRVGFDISLSRKVCLFVGIGLMKAGASDCLALLQ
jgi:hypothetical protein